MEKHIRLASTLAQLLDSRFKIGRFGFGLDPIIGLIPVLGDILPVAASIYMIWIALRVGASNRIILGMLRNVAVDALVGGVPLIGDVADFFYKAYAKNFSLLQEAVRNSQSPK